MTQTQEPVYFTEKVNSDACEYILTLKQHEFFKVFPKKKEKSDESQFFGKGYYSYVRNILYDFKSHKYKRNIKYETSDLNFGKGRLYANKGIQNVDSDLRKFLTQGIYYDYDMKNAHPNILRTMCENNNLMSPHLQNYCQNRTTFLEENNISKQQILKLINQDKPCNVKQYSDDVQLFLAELKVNKNKLYVDYKDKYHVKERTKNPISSCINHHLCHVENKILQCALKKIDKSKVGVLMFDGFMTEEKLTSEQLSNLTINMAEWDEKENISHIEIPEKENSTLQSDETGCRPDEIHAENFRRLFKGKHARTEAGFFIYDEKVGIWTNEYDGHYRILSKYSKEIFPIKDDFDKNRTFKSVFAPAYDLIKTNAPPINEFNNHCYDVGFLCFANGVLDMKTKTMLPFDSKYRFTVSIERDYDPSVDYSDKKNEIMERLFNKQFTDYEKRDYMLEKFARGFAGCSSMIDKQFQYLIGETNCGKGTFTKLCKNAFSSYVEEFNADNILLSEGNSGDNEKDKKWIIPFANKRLAISNEITMKTETTETKFGKKKKIVGINAEILKMLVSCGDGIKARLLGSNSIKIVNKANICIMVNDIPHVSPVSEPYLDRANYIQMDRGSSKNITEDNENEFVADNSINDFCRSVYTGNAFVDLMCDFYKQSVQNGLKPKPESVLHKTRELSGAGESGSDWIKERYDVHENPKLFEKNDGKIDWKIAEGWFLHFDTVYSIYLDTGSKISKTRFGLELKKMGLLTGDKKIKGKKRVVIIGLRVPRECYIQDDDEII